MATALDAVVAQARRAFRVAPKGTSAVLRWAGAVGRREWVVIHGTVLSEKGGKRIEHAWCETLRELGLGPVHVRGREFRFAQLNGDDSARVILAAGSSLEDLITCELNRPFAAGEAVGITLANHGVVVIPPGRA